VSQQSRQREESRNVSVRDSKADSNR